MRLEKITTPELVLNRRGNISLRQMISNLLPNMDINPEGEYSLIPHNNFYDILKKEANIRQFIYSAKRWATDRQKKIYYFPKDFSNALTRVKCNLIPDFLPDNFTAYLYFSDLILDTGSFSANGCFVTILPVKSVLEKLSPKYLSESPCDRILSITIENIQDTENQSPICFLNLALGNNSLEQSLETAMQYGDFKFSIDKEKIIKTLRLILNGLMYLHSANAELDQIKPNYDLTKSEKKKQRELGKENMGTLPLVLVNWNYGKDIVRVYTQEKVFVDTYLRWQRFGVNNSLIKLIWVREHEKTYKVIN